MTETIILSALFQVTVVCNSVCSSILVLCFEDNASLILPSTLWLTTHICRYFIKILKLVPKNERNLFTRSQVLIFKIRISDQDLRSCWRCHEEQISCVSIAEKSTLQPLPKNVNEVPDQLQCVHIHLHWTRHNEF